MHISTFTLKGRDVDITYRNGFLAYTFDFNGEKYGTKVKVPSQKTMDIVACTYQLFTSALESIEQLEKKDDGDKRN